MMFLQRWKVKAKPQDQKALLAMQGLLGDLYPVTAPPRS